jgi:hypothetical protein
MATVLETHDLSNQYEGDIGKENTHHTHVFGGTLGCAH